MLILTLKTPPFAVVERPIATTAAWPGKGLEQSQIRLSGPVNLDVLREWEEHKKPEQWIPSIIESAIAAALELEGASDERARELRSLAWRGAHKFVVDNVYSVDRGTELNELAKLLGVDRK